MMRRYNRWHARFDQPDPYDGSYDLSDPQSLNRYSYVQNDPVNFTDPSGLERICVPTGPYEETCYDVNIGDDVTVYSGGQQGEVSGLLGSGSEHMSVERGGDSQDGRSCPSSASELREA